MIVRKFDPVEMVVAKGLRALLTGKPSVVTGWLNCVEARLTRLFTRRFLAKLTYRIVPPEIFCRSVRHAPLIIEPWFANCILIFYLWIL